MKSAPTFSLGTSTALFQTKGFLFSEPVPQDEAEALLRADPVW